MTSSGSKSMVFELTEETRFNVGRSTGKTINYSATKYDLRISIANSEGVVWEQKKSHYDFPSGGTIPKGKDPVSHLREQAAKGLKGAIERFFLNFAPPAIIYYQPKIDKELGLGTSVIDTRVVQELSLAGLPPGVKPMHLKQPKPPKAPRFPSKSAIEPRLSDEFARPCRAYVNKVYADLLGRDESTWKTTLKWCEALKRPVVGLRWGFGVQFSGTKPSKAFVDPKPTTTELEKSLKALTAGVGPKLIDHLKLKSRNKEFGTWPTSGDPRVKQPVLLGGGSRQELLDGANGVGLDFIVVASFAPTGTGKRRETSMMIRVLDVDSGKQLFGSVRHKGSQLQDPTKNLGDAVVADVIKWIDENLSLQEISDKSVRSVVSDRLDTIKRSNHPRIPMAVLAEVRMYQHMNKLSAKKASGYYAQLLPQPDAEILANGTAEERRAVLEKAAPQIVK